jgi:hypothetical protein
LAAAPKPAAASAAALEKALSALEAGPVSENAGIGNVGIGDKGIGDDGIEDDAIEDNGIGDDGIGDNGIEDVNTEVNDVEDAGGENTVASLVPAYVVIPDVPAMFWAWTECPAVRMAATTMTRIALMVLHPPLLKDTTDPK